MMTSHKRASNERDKPKKNSQISCVDAAKLTFLKVSLVRSFFFSQSSGILRVTEMFSKNTLTCARTRPRAQLASGGLVAPPVPPIKGLRSEFFIFFPPLCSESTPVFPPSGF